MKIRRNKIYILGIPIDSFTKIKLLRFIKQKIKGKKPLFITTVNAEFLYQASKDKAVSEMLLKSSLNLADGIGVLWAAKYLSLSLPKSGFFKGFVGFLKLITSLLSIIFYPKFTKYPIPEKISGSDFIWDLSRFAAKNNLKIFLLGGAQTVPEQAALKLQTDIYNLRVVGTFSGSPRIEDEKKIIKIIKKDQPDILFVAYGVPAEEFWIERNLAKTGVKIAIGVGGTFDFLAGRSIRAPKIIRFIGLEWLWRLILEPKRYKRQIALPKFIWRIFKHKIQN